MSKDDEDEAVTRRNAFGRANPDAVATAVHVDAVAQAELRATLAGGVAKSLQLYARVDRIVVGRGSACDWQLDDPSLSRRHAQLEWDGARLTVQDLGSANGTRVGLRAADRPLPVGADDVVMLGSVRLVLVPLVARAADAVATRVVALPLPQPAAPVAVSAMVTLPVAPQPREPAAPSPHTPQPGTPARGLPIAPGRAAVFRPDRDVAEPDEATRRWDAGAVLVHTRPRPAASRWPRHRRAIVLAGASVWMALLVGLLLWQDARDAAEATAVRPTGVVAAAPAPPPEPATADNIVEPSVDRAADLEAAIAAYDNGRPGEALRYFRRLAADPQDETARFMVRLIESKAGAAP